MARKQRKVTDGRNRGSIKPKGRNLWIVRVFTGRNAAGVRQYVAKQVNGTYKQAETVKTAMLGEIDKGGVVAVSKQTVAQYMEQWITSTVAIRVSPRTLNSYRYMVEHHMLPAIGGVRLATLTPNRVQQLYSDMLASGLSPRVVRYTHMLLKNAMSQAVSWRQLPFNPCADVALPPMVKNPPVPLTPFQVKRILEETAGDTYGTFWNVMLNTGMRPQEAAVLQWTDIVGSTVTISKALVETAPGHYEAGPTKTDGSERRIAIPSSTVIALAEHRAAQTRQILKAGAKYERNGLVFATRDGKLLSLHNLWKGWCDTMRRLDLPKVTLYNCRHTHISLLLAAGEPVVDVSKRAGHSSAKMTLDVYGHVIPGTESRTADTFDSLITNAKEPVAAIVG